jgi:hypothetical protein
VPRANGPDLVVDLFDERVALNLRKAFLPNRVRIDPVLQDLARAGVGGEDFDLGSLVLPSRVARHARGEVISS